MPKTEQHEQNKDLEQRQHETKNVLIGEQVIRTLGEPGGLHNVQVRRLWEDRYRVNVFIGEDAASAKIANSYFVKADGGGNIVESNPKIKNLYQKNSV